MLLIETNIGTYGTYRDLYLDMVNRGIQEITYRLYYVFDLITRGRMNIEDVKGLYEKECGIEAE